MYNCTIDLLFEFVCFANKNKIVICHKADSKPVKQEVNSTEISPPLIFPDPINDFGQTLLLLKSDIDKPTSVVRLTLCP